MTFETRLRVAVACAMLLAACGGDADGSPTSLSITAQLGSTPREASEVLVLWNVTSGSPDYIYLWGRANFEGDSFELALRQRPPADAINNYGLGVGYLLISPRSVGLPDGKLTKDQVASLGTLSGGSERQAIIWVDHDQANARIDALAPMLTAEELERSRKHWLFDFPQGYSCGNGRPPRDGETFDGYEPIDCDQIEMRLGDLEAFEFPNWT